MKITNEIVKELGLKAGASVVGIAAASDFILAPEGFHPRDVLEGCRSVIILAVPMPQEALENSAAYTETRNAMVKQMTAIAKKAEKHILKSGCKAKAISATGGKYIDGISHGHISLKHAAELAGLGVIGKNYLLTNPEYGNLLWLSAVLTDAELIPGQKAQYNFCENCSKCVDACPAKALDIPDVFDKKACANTCFKQVNGKWELACFLCRTVCPYCFGNISSG